MIENVEGLKPVPIPFSGGIDEESPVDGLLPEDALKMLNWRLSKNGKRIQKRAGLQEEDTAFGEDVYGLATYYNATPAFCKLAVLESEIQRKVGAAAWANIFDFTSNIDHTVKVHEIQDKQFVITEKGARVILSNGDVRQIGITAPATLPTATPGYASAATPPLNELWAYADQAALDAAWTDVDATGNTSSLVSGSDPDGTPGPDADQKYLRLQSIAGYGMYAGRRRTITGDIGESYALEIVTYFEVLTYAGGIGGVVVKIDNGDFNFRVTVGNDGAYILGKNGFSYQIMTGKVPINKWIRWNFSIEKKEGDISISVKGFCTYDSAPQLSGQANAFFDDSATTGMVEIQGWGVSADTYVDHIRITPTTPETASITGVYRYAVSFVRTGNYGCESNPIKSSIGTIAFTGAGLNDMTLDAESSYTGTPSKTIRVRVKTAASPQDTIEWSEDAGLTWRGELKLATKVYLGLGITVNFAAITGHTATNYWEIPCTCSSTIATNQQVTLTSIPVSADEQVTARKIYRTTAGGSIFYYLTTIYDRNVTTQFVDNFPDMTLGDEMEEDRDLFSAASSTIGKFSEWWDNRLWIADHSENVVYYSAVREGGGVPEEFSLDERFIPLNKGDQDDVITAMIAFKDALYVFKRNDIFIIQKTAFGYAPYHLNSDVGCIADNGVISVNDLLMFPSERGLEIYDGVKPFGPEFSVAINATFLTADPAGYKYMSIAHDKQFNEVWFSMPSRLSGAAAITTVWNYVRNRFYFFQFYKTPSCLVSCKDSTGKRVLKMGTRDGFIDLCDYGTADHTTPITATYRKGWLDMHAHGIARLLTTKYELPATKTLTANIYVDMQSAVFRTDSLTGATPGAVDTVIRKVVGDKSELGTRHRWIAVEYTNAEDCGGDCKINEAFLMVRPDVIKNKTNATT